MRIAPIKILMTGAGAPGAAGIIHCLLRDPAVELVTADANSESVGRYLSPSFEQIPYATDPGFGPALLELCVKHHIQLVLPLVTKELIPLAIMQEEFKRVGTRILVSSLASVEIANNKSRLYEFLQWRGMEVPDFRVVETLEQFVEAVGELGYPGRPVCFKPSVSNGSRGFRIITESIDEHELLFCQKPNHTYIKLPDALRILASRSFPELLVSEWLPGEEYSVDCLAKEGEALLVLPRSRIKMINGISVQGEFVKDEGIIEYCRQIIRELQLDGNIGIQVKKSSAGRFLILEINPRVQGSICTALGAGINLPLLAVKSALDRNLEPDELKVKWGVKFLRYWSEVFY